MKVLITGSSSGIGLSLAKEFAKNNYDLVLVARRKIILDNVALQLSRKYAIKVEVEPLDLTVAKNVDILIKKYSASVDILINNAGFGYQGRFLEQSNISVSGMIFLNITALTLLTHGFAKSMSKNGGGKIVNVSSILARVKNFPSIALYGATKKYVMALSQSINAEQRGNGVRIYTVCPGLVKTEFAKRAKMRQQDFKKATSPDVIASKIVNKLLKKHRDLRAFGRGAIITKFVWLIPRKIINRVLIWANLRAK